MVMTGTSPISASAVMTARTPGRVSAADASIERMRPCATALRRIDGVQRAGARHVIDILAAAAQEAQVLQPLDRAADEGVAHARQVTGARALRAGPAMKGDRSLNSRAGVTGYSSIRTPNGESACSIAETMRRAAGTQPDSPTPLTPSGLSGDGYSANLTSMFGTSVAVASR